MKRAILFSAVACTLLMQGCLGTIAEKDSVLSTDSENVIAEAEIQPGESELTKIVTIRSNRSWFAHLNDLDNPVDAYDPSQSVPWATLSVERHSNLTNVMDETEVVVTFQRNLSQTPINGVLNIYSEGKVVKSIPICQKGAVYHLSATASKLDADPDADLIPITIDCNTKWRIKAADGTDANVELSQSEGFDPGVVNVKFNENFSSTSTKKARIAISAESCEDVILEITQNKAVPYIYIVKDTETRVVSGETTASTWIRTNSDWTASVVSSELENFTVVNASGVAGNPENQEVKVSFESNPENPYSVKSATVRFNVEGADPVDFTFTQRGIFEILFNDADRFNPTLETAMVKGADGKNGCRSAEKTIEDIDTYYYTNDTITIPLRMSQYMSHSVGTRCLYTYGSGKRPFIGIGGLKDLSLRKITLRMRYETASNDRNYLSGAVRTEDHVLGEDGRTAPEKNLSNFTIFPKWTKDNSLLDFNLLETGKTLQPGEGCVIQFSDQSSIGAERCTNCFIYCITLKYL